MIYSENMNSINSSSNKDLHDDFQSLSPNQMHGLLYSPFDNTKSPMFLNEKVDDKIISQISFVNHSKRFLELVRDQHPLKLTANGFLPRKFCRELIELDIVEGIDRDWFRKHPLMRETDNSYIYTINVFTKICGLTNKKKNVISITNKCNDFLDKKTLYEFYKYLFQNYTLKFNWGFSDGYPDSWIIQGGFGFSILLVQKYGGVLNNINFYSSKYLQAFPALMKDFPDTPIFSGHETFKKCYFLRVFNRFLKRFGFVKIESSSLLDKNPKVKKTELVDQLIQWKI